MGSLQNIIDIRKWKGGQPNLRKKDSQAKKLSCFYVPATASAQKKFEVDRKVEVDHNKGLFINYRAGHEK